MSEQSADTVSFDVDFDWDVGKEGRSQSVLLAHLAAEPNFDFKPKENVGDVQTVKIEEYLISNENNSLRDLEDVKKTDEKLFLHGNVRSWSGGDFKLSICGVRVRCW